LNRYVKALISPQKSGMGMIVNPRLRKEKKGPFALPVQGREATSSAPSDRQEKGIPSMYTSIRDEKETQESIVPLYHSRGEIPKP